MYATIYQYNYRYLHGYISVAIFPEIHVFQSLIDFPSGKFGLEGLFLRLGFAIDSVGAKRVVLFRKRRKWQKWVNLRRPNIQKAQPVYLQ